MGKIYAMGIAMITAIVGVLTKTPDDYRKFTPVVIATIVLLGLGYIYSVCRERKEAAKKISDDVKKAKDKEDHDQLISKMQHLNRAVQETRDRVKRNER